MITRRNDLPTAVLGGAALAAALTTLALLALGSGGGASFQNMILAFLAWLALFFFITALVAGTLGLAWHAYASQRGWKSIHAYWAPGLIAGLFVPFVLFLLPTIADGSTASVAFVVWGFGSVYGAALGGFTGLFAWLIRRPDRDPANPPTSSP